MKQELLDCAAATDYYAREACDLNFPTWQDLSETVKKQWREKVLATHSESFEDKFVMVAYKEDAVDRDGSRYNSDLRIATNLTLPQLITETTKIIVEDAFHDRADDDHAIHVFHDAQEITNIGNVNLMLIFKTAATQQINEKKEQIAAAKKQREDERAALQAVENEKIERALLKSLQEKYPA